MWSESKEMETMLHRQPFQPALLEEILPLVQLLELFKQDQFQVLY